MSAAPKIPKPLLTATESQKLDASKLHSEVTQLVSQRFHLTVTAIVVFSAVCGWVTPSISEHTVEALNMASASCILLLIVLAVFCFYFHMLLGMMRIYTTYIERKYGSQWEGDWKEYRLDQTTKTYLGYSKAGGAVFIALGVLSFIYPHALFLLSSLASGEHAPNLFCAPLAWVSFIGMIVYLVVVWLIVYRRHRFHDEDKIKSDWNKVLTKMEAERQNAQEDF